MNESCIKDIISEFRVKLNNESTENLSKWMSSLTSGHSLESKKYGLLNSFAICKLQLLDDIERELSYRLSKVNENDKSQVVDV